MSADNPSFRSYSGDYFWSPASPEEKEQIANKIAKDCSRTAKGHVIYIIAALLFVLTQTFSYLYIASELPTLALLMIVVVFWTIFPAMDSIVSAKRYIKKAKAGQFLCRHVRVINKQETPGLIPSCYISIRGTGDRSDVAEVKINKGLYNNMTLGDTGTFVMVEDMPSKLLFDPFWYFSDKAPEPVLSESSEEFINAAPAVPEVAEEDIHKRIRQRYYRYCTSYITTSVLACFLFLAGSLFTAAAFTNELTRMVILMAVPITFAGLFLVSMSLIKMINRGKVSYGIFYIIWLHLNVFSLAITTEFMDSNKTVVYLTILITFLINLFSVYFANREFISVTGKINKKQYRILPAEVIRKDQRVRPLHISKIYSCTVRTENDRVYEIWIDKGIYDTIKTGTKGHIIFTGKDDSDRLFI